MIQPLTKRRKYGIFFFPKWKFRSSENPALAQNMNYFKRKLTWIPALRRGIEVFVLILASLSMSVPQAQAWSGPTWFRLAVAEEVPEPTFVVPERAIAPSYPYKTKVDITAYTSSVEECDSDPFITADGSHTRDGIIATNFLPFGTKVRIPTLFGDRIFEVHDRMNSRYWYRFDIWMSDKKEMRQFGLKRNVTFEIVQMGDGKTQWGKKVLEKKVLENS